MSKQDIGLTPTEWHLMECLWERAPKTGREAVDYLEKKVGWSRSTTLTMLRRMTEKGVIKCGDADGVKIYTPAIRREDAVVHETDDFINRVYNGSVSLMMSAITHKQELTREEIDELYAILREAEVKAND